MDRDRIDDIIMTLPLETDFDLSNDKLADSLRKVLASSVAEAIVSGGEPVRILTLRTGFAVTVKVQLCGSGGKGCHESIHRYCVQCGALDCDEHAAMA